MAAADIETAILAAVDDAGEIPDSGEFAQSLGKSHNEVYAVINSLCLTDYITMEPIEHSALRVTEEGQNCIELGSPEARLWEALPADGMALADIKASLPPEVADSGFKQAMQAKWVALDKSGGAPLVKRAAESIVDAAKEQLAAVAAGGEADAKEAALLTKRKLLKQETWKTFRLGKGPRFARQRTKQATDLTVELLASGAWAGADFKAYNFDALGLPPAAGCLHPLLKVRTQFRKIFTQLGFTEMPTSNYVESSFWNFDALFQPQQHPARDAHDTFFLTHPAATQQLPDEYLQRVKAMHERGGFGSAGYGYHWSRAEAGKNLLRTHTTAVSSRMLRQLAQDGFKPAKLFSIDRVFRNEAVDRTHLAEFHQVEGGYSAELGKWMEVGNSGMFRPEMLRPMGLPEGVNVIAWGLSLERPTMILYGIDNIRDLFGHKVSLSMVRSNPICRLGL